MHPTVYGHRLGVILVAGWLSGRDVRERKSMCTSMAGYQNDVMSISETDLEHLRRCVELAREALEDGDDPFGSVLVDADGRVRFEDRNRVSDGDQTQHPEFEIARWSASRLAPTERRNATVYTSGEHCPMCSAATPGWAWEGSSTRCPASSSCGGEPNGDWRPVR